MAISPTALITGANKGIGFEVARQLGQRGFTVWLGCRDEGRGNQAGSALLAEGIQARLLLLDVEKADDILAAARRFGEQNERLDVLVNNAGMHFGPPPAAYEEPLEQVEAIFRVNVFGVLRVTQAFVPYLKQSPAGRIVMMTSGLGSIGETMNPQSENWPVGFAGYSASKTALNMFTVKLAKELESFGIKVNAADPGLTATDLTGQAGSRTPKDAARVAVELATLDSAGPNAGFFKFDHPAGLVAHPW